jgi:predicted nucleotidyltransferase
MTTKALVLGDNRPLMTRLEEFLCDANTAVPLHRVLLFGSTAKGTRKAESDVDLIVISKNFDNVPELERSGRLLDMWSYSEHLQVLAYTPKEFRQVKERFMMKKILSYAIDLTPNKTLKCQTTTADT